MRRQAEESPEVKNEREQMKTKASKVPVWADTPENRYRIQEMLAKGMSVTEIGREFGVSRQRIAPLVKAVRKSDVVLEMAKDRGEKPRLVGMRDVGIDFRHPGDEVLTHISAEQIGVAVMFLRAFHSAENAKIALDEVAKLMAAAA